MWKLSKHLKLSRANSELERLLLERTAALQNLSLACLSCRTMKGGR